MIADMTPLGIDPAVWPAILTLAVALGMFALFVREIHPPEVVAVGGVSVLIATGILPIERMMGVFSNPAPLTIAAMFILSSALIRTGTLDVLTRRMGKRAGARPRRVLAGFAGLTVTASAFMNNTPVVVMLMPAAAGLARRLKVPASRLLLPLSYTAVMGGLLTLIGTSTNLLVDGIAREAGLAPFGLFEITPLALIIVAAGLFYLTTAGPRLLPNRGAAPGLLSNRSELRFFTEVVVPRGSDLIGRRVCDVDYLNRPGMSVVNLIRRGAKSRDRALGARNAKNAALEAGDRVVIRAGVDDLLGLRGRRSLDLIGQLDAFSQRSAVTVAAAVTPGCRMIGGLMGKLHLSLRGRYGVYPLAIHRKSKRAITSVDDVRIVVGDTLLLEGAPEDIQRLAAEQGLANLTGPVARSYRRDRAPIALGTLALVVGGAALGLAPIAGLAVIGVAVVLFTRCIDAEEAFEAVNLRLLTLIFSMLGVGLALQDSGAIGLIVDLLFPILDRLPPQAVLWIVFLMASILTELISNSAVAAIMTPIAISLAHSLGIDPRPFVVAVMVAASASFATPIGYQTNTLVYAAGGYRFTDYMRLGIPMNLGISVISALAIPAFWAF